MSDYSYFLRIHPILLANNRPLQPSPLDEHFTPLPIDCAHYSVKLLTTFLKIHKCIIDKKQLWYYINYFCIFLHIFPCIHNWYNTSSSISSSGFNSYFMSWCSLSAVYLNVNMDYRGWKRCQKPIITTHIIAVAKVGVRHFIFGAIPLPGVVPIPLEPTNPNWFIFSGDFHACKLQVVY